MTTHRSHRAPTPPLHPGRPVERAVTVALVLAVIAALGWTAGMVYTVLGWPL
ncbi:morphogenic membrane protein MmpA [Streptomyces sp. NPDC004082]|uniref:morphogenic membrane protein MmpA n=1 Tax=unclassified Streptomyces TaxID=2593676 RepID=UPI0033B3689F